MKKLFSKILPALGVYFSRLGFLPANLTPLGAYGFFGGQPWLFLVSIIAFDYFVGGFYRGFLWTYAGFLVYPLFGYLARHSRKLQLLLLPAASFGFFLLSNFGVFLAWYEQSWQGLLTCYALALPFYTRTLLGDLIFGYGYLLLRQLCHLRQFQRLAFLRRLGYNVL